VALVLFGLDYKELKANYSIMENLSKTQKLIIAAILWIATGIFIYLYLS